MQEVGKSHMEWLALKLYFLLIPSNRASSR